MGGGAAGRLCRHFAVSACAVAIAVAVGACGGDEASNELPAGSVARVGDTLISDRQLARQVARERRGRPSGSSGARQLETQALETLLRQRWIEQEAAENGVEVSVAEARQRWRQVARRQFRNRRARVRFLAGRSEADIATQLRVQTLAERTEAAIRSDQGAAAAARFRRDLTSAWRSSATCRPRYAVRGCGSP
jgi:hypothetical protein